jgi:hypothetical protein
MVYCKLSKTRIFPEAFSSGSSAFPINVPGMCMRRPPTLMGSDFIAKPGTSLVTNKSPI